MTDENGSIAKTRKKNNGYLTWSERGGGYKDEGRRALCSRQDKWRDPKSWVWQGWNAVQ